MSCLVIICFSVSAMLMLHSHTGGTTAQCQLQLVGGFGASSGYLQVFVGEWRYASLSSQASSDGGDALCQQLGFEGASNMSMVPVGDVR